jgi:hypothetical protein
MNRCGKKSYSTYLHARNDARSIRQNYGDGEGADVYRCRHCQHWHVGRTGERAARRSPRRAQAWCWRTAASEQEG